MNFKKEIDFIIGLLRGNVDNISDFETSDLLYLLKYHRLNGYAYRLLVENDLLSQDNDFYDSLVSAHRVNVILNSLLKGELTRLGKLLHAKNIPFLVFKGFSLANSIYPDDEYRQFADIDIVVLPNDLRTVEWMLYDNNYKLIEGFHSKFEVEDSSRLGISRPYIHEKIESLQIDLHPTISIGPGFKYAEIDDLWNETDTFSMNGRTYQTLNKGLYLVYLCWHAVKHSVSRLVWFRDIYLFVKENEDVFSDRTLLGYLEKYKARKIVCTALKLTSVIFENKEISDIADNLNDGSFRLKKGYFNIEKLFLPRNDISGITRTMRDLYLLETARERSSYLFKALLPHPDYIAEMPRKVKSRWNLRYFINRIKSVIRKSDIKILED